MICLTNLSKSYGTRRLLHDLNFHFPHGERIALVGDNGAGKSTLLNILCDLEHYDDGSLVKPHNLKIGYLPQEPNPEPKPSILEECLQGDHELVKLNDAMEKALEVMSEDPSTVNCQRYEDSLQAFQNGGGFEWEANAKGILVGLGFSQTTFDKDPRTLSGGWRMRLELGKLFLAEPDFLILDEPTNHLDLPSLIWVENYLQTFPGTLLFVSHDRKLLNKLATMTLHLSQGKLKSYTGNFDAFQIALAENIAHQTATFTQLEKKKEQLERFVDRFGAKASKAKQAQSKQKLIDKLHTEQSTISIPTQQASIAFTLPEPPPVERVAGEIKHLDIGYRADMPLAKNINLQIERGQKIAVIGANGIGKSTFLRTITQLIPALGGEAKFASKAVVSFFAQDQLDVLNPKDTVINNLTSLTQISEKEARSLLGSFLFRGDDVFKPVQVLSGGEKSRVGLAVTLARRANILLLDEPTNHLDMNSVDALISALQRFKGTVIFVSHDRTFIDSICSHVFAMVGDGRSMLFEGQLEDYQQLAGLANFPNVLLSDSTAQLSKDRASKEQAKVKEKESKPQPTPAANQKQERNRLEKLMTQAEKRVTELTKQINALENQIADVAPTDFTTMGNLHREKEGLDQKLALAEEEWLQAQEKLEGLQG